MGAKKLERTPPKYQPVMMDEQGNYYKQNPEYTKNMAKVQKHPFGMVARNPGKFAKDGMPDQYIPISGEPKSKSSRYGKAKSYDVNRKV